LRNAQDSGDAGGNPVSHQSLAERLRRLAGLLIADVGIALGGANILVAEQLLDFPQILSYVVEQDRGRAVAQSVCCDLPHPKILSDSNCICDCLKSLGSYFTCPETCFVISNIVTCFLPPKTALRASSALVSRPSCWQNDALRASSFLRMAGPESQNPLPN